MQLTHTYLELGERFFELNSPASFRRPSLFLWNTEVEEQLNLSGEFNSEVEQAHYFSGNRQLPTSKPLSMAYAGHQFGHFNPQLGDGRAHLLGEILDEQGNRWDLQLKGSGQSAFSRNGDGRCALGPAIREFIMSEAMYYLGVPTTRCLAVTKTGESVYRQSQHEGAVVTRIASSHIRVGTFQYFAAKGDIESLRRLADYTIERHYPEVLQQKEDKYVQLLASVIEQQIELVVQWLRVGFIHGVMNTDNTAISGETIDYGPCAMMGAYDPKTVYSSIDRNGRYAFGNQAQIAHWNMARFAEALLQLANDDNDLLEPMQRLIDDFSDKFNQTYVEMMHQKLGLKTINHELLSTLTSLMLEHKLDYTKTFDLLTRSLTCNKALELVTERLGDWVRLWSNELDENEIDNVQQLMRKANPVIIPRNHIVEGIIEECEATGKPDAVMAFLKALKAPYQDTELAENYKMSDHEFNLHYQTFCGT
ncbi:YdiU family protein [Shewanella sp. OPT22]|nr:YdiU family protein [Shewanella sp. OPT22]